MSLGRIFSLSASLARPGVFVRVFSPLGKACGLLALLSGGGGLWLALFVSPPDFRQGEAVRLMYIHVPSAQMALLIYTIMAGFAIMALIWRHPVAELVVRESATPGLCFAGLCLATGMLWGRPSWGIWWVWDARLTSMLILFFTYIGYFFLREAHSARSSTTSLLFIVAGAVNLPIVKFSVDWWHTLHQPASLLRKGGIAIDASMLTPLLLMSTSMAFFYAWLLSQRVKASLFEAKWRRLILGLGEKGRRI